MKLFPSRLQRPPAGIAFLLSLLAVSCGGGGSAESTATGTSATTPSAASVTVAATAGSKAVNASPGTTSPTTGTTGNPDPTTAAPTAPTADATPSLMPYVNPASILAGAAGYSTDRIQATTEIAPDSDIGAFRTTCDFAFMSFDDPIVYPGQPGKAHLHTFFGNTDTDASGDPVKLASTGNSTCRGGTVNRTKYWIPTIIDTATGKPVTPASISPYYKTGYNGVRPQDVQPFPAGLRMIAGDASATGETSDPWFFGCDGGSVGRYKVIPQCVLGDVHNLFASIDFPQCWDGKNLDSPDHKSHMAYANPSIPGCPADHPIPLPLVSYNVWWSIPDGTVMSNWRLSSDNYAGLAGYSFHADWFNGWKSEVMEAFVKSCLNKSKDCHSHLLGEGRMIY